jgi:hypothetical protein
LEFVVSENNSRKFQSWLHASPGQIVNKRCKTKPTAVARYNEELLVSELLLELCFSIDIATAVIQAQEKNRLPSGNAHGVAPHQT